MKQLPQLEKGQPGTFHDGGGVMALDHTDIQGNLLRGYRLPFARYIFLNLGPAEQGRAFLGEMAERVTNAEIWDDGKPLHTQKYRAHRALL